ncbi:MAG: AAA family ATPase [Saprospiraceae bacterium]|jgi:predicted ATPase|nr:AAA family ATPase [Saprospiraceae bacterium]
MINRIVIDNFKSIRHLDLELKPLNVLIGANGSGKSNLIGFLEMWRKLFEGHLSGFFTYRGGAESILHFGTRKSDFLGFSIYFNEPLIEYSLKLRPHQNFAPTLLPGLLIESERIIDLATNRILSEGVNEPYVFESKFFKDESNRKPFEALNDIGIYYFETSSPWKSGFHPFTGFSFLEDNRSFRENADNLPSFLYYLQQKHSKTFNRIEATVRSIAPFFEKFDLSPSIINEGRIELVWKHEGSDNYFNANHLSSGSFRFICLATLLLQPNPPKLIVIDEPELGLHPFAIGKLAALIKKASNHTQLIIATQSPALVSEFDPEDIITVDWKDGQSTFQRHTTEELAIWLEDYSMGEIWDKNIIGGRP